MIKKETIKSIENLLGLNADELANALSNEKEVDLTISKSKAFSSDEWDSHLTNVDAEKKERYDSGKEAGVGMNIRDLKEKIGMDYEGKSPELFIQKYKEFVIKEAKIEPDKRITNLEQDNEQLRTTITAKDLEIKTATDSVGKLKTNFEIEKQYDQYIPKNAEGWKFEDLKTIVKANVNIGIVDNKPVLVDPDGEVIKNDLREPVKIADGINDFLLTRNIKTTNGRGGGDSNLKTDGGITNYAAFEKKMIDQGINPKSIDAQLELNKLTKDNKDFTF